MQYHSCMCILGLAEPQNWLNPGVGGGLYSIIPGLSTFLEKFTYFLTCYFNILVEKSKIENKKKMKRK